MYLPGQQSPNVLGSWPFFCRAIDRFSSYTLSSNFIFTFWSGNPMTWQFLVVSNYLWKGDDCDLTPLELFPFGCWSWNHLLHILLTASVRWWDYYDSISWRFFSVQMLELKSLATCSVYSFGKMIRLLWLHSLRIFFCSDTEVEITGCMFCLQLETPLEVSVPHPIRPWRSVTGGLCD